MTETDEYGRPNPPFAGDETSTLVGFLDYQRATLEWKCRGLSDEQLQRSIPPTNMSLGGLLKHLARVEDHWFSEIVAEGPKLAPWNTMPWAAEWSNAAQDSGAGLRGIWAARVQASRDVVRRALESGSLDDTHPAWGGQVRPSVRWVLVHMIEEYARHNGHADLLRQAIDGETGE